MDASITRSNVLEATVNHTFKATLWRARMTGLPGKCSPRAGFTGFDGFGCDEILRIDVCWFWGLRFLVGSRVKGIRVLSLL